MDFLVIDEIGMVDAEYLDWVDATVREIRGAQRQHLAFGGVQLLCCGDFAQLPPVPSNQLSLQRSSGGGGDVVDDDYREVPTGVTELSALAFQTAFWRDAHFACLQLRKGWRQLGEAAIMVRALERLRAGVGDCPEVRFLVSACSRAVPRHPAIEPTTLYATRRRVHERNQDQLSRCPGITFEWLRGNAPRQTLQSDKLSRRISVLPDFF